MNSSEIVETFRAEMADKIAPYFWSDELLFGYLDDAQTMFCRLTDGIADARTPEVCQLSIVPGTDWYALHPAVKQIRSATRSDNGRPVNIYSHEQAQREGIVFLAANVGKVTTLVAGADDHEARVWPMPNETITLNLSVYRLPMVTITDFGDQVLEVDPMHHRHLLHWMKSRALSNQDGEIVDRAKADEYEAKFREYCKQAKQDQRTARRAPRNVAYGGL